jgi:hypothetical protein
MLDALNDAIDQACEALHNAGVDRYEIESCFPQYNEDTRTRGYQSVVFTSDDFYEMGDYDEAMETVMLVGARDLQYKIEEAQRTLRNLNDLLDPPTEEMEC